MLSKLINKFILFICQQNVIDLFIQVMMKTKIQTTREQNIFFYIAKLLQYYLYVIHRDNIEVILQYKKKMNIKLPENFPSREAYIK